MRSAPGRFRHDIDFAVVGGRHTGDLLKGFGKTRHIGEAAGGGDVRHARGAVAKDALGQIDLQIQDVFFRGGPVISQKELGKISCAQPAQLGQRGNTDFAVCILFLDIRRGGLQPPDVFIGQIAGVFRRLNPRNNLIKQACDLWRCV